MDVTSFLKFVAVDILLIGLLTLLLLAFMRNLWKTPDEPGDAVTKAGDALQFPGGGKTKGIALLVLAAVLGMSFNATADALLDTDCFAWLVKNEDEIKEFEVSHMRERLTEDQREVVKKHLPQLKHLQELADVREKVKALDPDSAKDRSEMGDLVEKLKMITEDGLPDIKPDTADKARRLKAGLREYFGEHFVYPAKGIVQHAFAELMRSGKPTQQKHVEGELQVLKVLRVLFLDGLILGVFCIVLLFRGRKEPDAAKRQRTGWPFLVAFLALVGSWGALHLWERQSERYYKKLIHAYVATAAAPRRVPPSATNKPAGKPGGG